MAGTARDVAPRTAVTRLAWALCFLSATLALAGVALAAVNGKGPAELVTAHHAIGIMTTPVIAPIGALIVRRGPDHRSVQRPPPRPGRAGHPDG